jgi:hypothetical protein
VLAPAAGGGGGRCRRSLVVVQFIGMIELQYVYSHIRRTNPFPITLLVATRGVVTEQKRHDKVLHQWKKVIYCARHMAMACYVTLGRQAPIERRHFHGDILRNTGRSCKTRSYIPTSACSLQVRWTTVTACTGVASCERTSCSSVGRCSKWAHCRPEFESH